MFWNLMNKKFKSFSVFERFTLKPGILSNVILSGMIESLWRKPTLFIGYTVPLDIINRKSLLGSHGVMKLMS